MGSMSCERQQQLVIVFCSALHTLIGRSMPLRVYINHLPFAIFALKEDLPERVGVYKYTSLSLLVLGIRHLSASYAISRYIADFAFPPLPPISNL